MGNPSNEISNIIGWGVDLVIRLGPDLICRKQTLSKSINIGDKNMNNGDWK